MLQFIQAHQAALAAIVYAILNEFVRVAPFITGNSIAQAVYTYVAGWLKGKAAQA